MVDKLETESVDTVTVGTNKDEKYVESVFNVDSKRDEVTLVLPIIVDVFMIGTEREDAYNVEINKVDA